MLRLHYVTGDHGNHGSGHRGQNLVTVRHVGEQGRQTLLAVVAGIFFNLSRFATISHGPQGKLRNIAGHFIGQLINQSQLTIHKGLPVVNLK